MPVSVYLSCIWRLLLIALSGIIIALLAADMKSVGIVALSAVRQDPFYCCMAVACCISSGAG
jgi:hypothetical protein